MVIPGADSGGCAPAVTPFKKSKRERERKIKKVITQEWAADPVETVLVIFCFLPFFGSH